MKQQPNNIETILEQAKLIEESLEEERKENFGRQAVKIVIGSEDEQEEL